MDINVGDGCIIRMIKVRGGQFVIGQPNSFRGRSKSELSCKKVNIRGFYLGK
ncbi:MAG: hypothetical protein GY861_21105 [bacterium]|nr:hypothetical protein [bacterium]